MEKNEKKKKFRRIMAILVVLLMLLLAGLFAWQRYAAQQNDAALLESGIKAKIGLLEDKSNDEIEATLDEIIEEGNLSININANPVFPTAHSAGTLMIENHPNNHYNMRVSITLDDTGEEIYNSGLMPVNTHIDEDVLSTPLDAGDYDATATFVAYDVDTDAEVGHAAAKIKISVLA